MRRRSFITVAAIGAAAVLVSAAGVSLTLTPVQPVRGATAQAAAGVPTAGGAGLPKPWRPRAVPLVIAHRGASAYRAEHTIGAYRLAMLMGADYIEADLVMTGDGFLVARHEHELSATTDVAHRPEFAHRRQTKVVGGSTVTGWFTEDFTLAELQTLTARPRYGRPTDPPAPDDPQTIPSLQQIIDLARDESIMGARPIGLYLELKLPGYFSSLGLSPETHLADVLRRNQLAHRDAAVIVESFEADSLRGIRRLVDVPIVQLLWGAGVPDDPTTSAAALASTREYAIGIGIDRSRLRACADSGLTLVRTAHEERLEVHVYTFANTAVQLPLIPEAYRPDDAPELANALAEYRMYYRLGVDGVFTDNPDVAVTARTPTR